MDGWMDGWMVHKQLPKTNAVRISYTYTLAFKEKHIPRGNRMGCNGAAFLSHNRGLRNYGKEQGEIVT